MFKQERIVWLTTMIPLLILSLVVSGVVSDSKSSSDLFRDSSRDNHHLTESEFANIFLSFDSNRNGEVTISEFESGWSHKHLRDSSEAGFFFTVADVDGNLRITRADMDYLFTVMDASADNSLSSAEFTNGWHNLFETGNGHDDDDD
ncbi:insoluble matrix shell protein 5-like [Pecten maximus]|uniref:insoluble matrix shell protein 5-like n=1 Tax=Pecten maximus TaxID=6579 RepID=UPI0014587A06|nr:insoluble matrix shell protein 5-like [Pecten maximus]